jgi:hypothetical protein
MPRNIASERHHASTSARLILRRIGYCVPGASFIGVGARGALAFASTAVLDLEPAAADRTLREGAASGALPSEGDAGSGFMMLTAGIDADDGKK